jgi:hypothetical protein
VPSGLIAHRMERRNAMTQDNFLPANTGRREDI